MVAKSWPEQVKLDQGVKPLNAEYEQWTIQLQRDSERDDGVKGQAEDCIDGDAKHERGPGQWPCRWICKVISKIKELEILRRWDLQAVIHLMLTCWYFCVLTRIAKVNRKSANTIETF